MSDDAGMEPRETAHQTMLSAGHEVVKWRQRRRWTLGISVLMFLFPLIVFTLWKPETVTPLSAWLMVGPLVLSMIGLLVGILMRPTRRNPLNQLWASQDVQAIGPLAESTQMLLPEMVVQAVASLERLLPRVNEHNAPQLTAYQRLCLHRLLGNASHPPTASASPAASVLDLTGLPIGAIKSLGGMAKGSAGFHPKLAEAILYAYLYIGDSDDLRVVRQMAKPAVDPMTQSVGAAALQKTAADVLSLLEERVREENLRAVSLRPSSAPASDGAELLRPAHGVTLAREELLHAVHSETQTDILSGQLPASAYAIQTEAPEPQGTIVQTHNA